MRLQIRHCSFYSLCPSPPDPGPPTPSSSRIQGTQSLPRPINPHHPVFLWWGPTIPYLTSQAARGTYLFRPQRDRPGQAKRHLRSSFLVPARRLHCLHLHLRRNLLSVPVSSPANEKPATPIEPLSLCLSRPHHRTEQSSNLCRHLPRRCQRHLTCDIWSVTTGHTRHFHFQFSKASERIEYLSIQITTPHPSFIPLRLSPYRRLFRTK